MSKRNSIIEGLNFVHETDLFFESIRESSGLDIFESPEFFENMIGVNEEWSVDEGSTVTFDGQAFPKFGWCTVLGGSPGSGKGYVSKHRIAINAKTFDVDRLKELYIAAQKAGKVKDDINYDLKNPKDVSALHQKVKEKGFKDKQEKMFFDSVAQGRDLPNILYDITGDDPEKLKNIAKKVKALGYKTSFVWIVTNRQMAMLQNLSRDRVVSQEIFHKIHNDVAKNIFPFLKNGAQDYDEAWIVFNSKDNAKQLSKQEYDEINKIGTVKLEKQGKGFNIPKEIEMMIYNILGPLEEDPLHPRVYKDFSEVMGNELEIEKVKAGLDTLLKKVN